MSVAESIEPAQDLAYQNGRAAFLLSELLSGDATKVVRLEAQSWLSQHEAWLSDCDDLDSDPWELTAEDDEADDLPDERPGAKLLYSEGWI